MNHDLWSKIAAFDFDHPESEYGFSARLASENYWTKSFTAEAMEEYRKFMYLAATSDFMVSPSEVVDIVWHQHLIFTQSYQSFCTILGKQIQHIPSTHNREDFSRFQQAKTRTNKLYAQDFGLQPENIWRHNNMFDSLKLEKARFKIRTFILAGILAFAGLAVPGYFLLRPLYIQIHNPFFIAGIIILITASLLLLESYNRKSLKKIVLQSDMDSFIHRLHPLELIYLKSQRIQDTINAVINELIDKGFIKINPDQTLESVQNTQRLSREQLQVIVTLQEFGKSSYRLLLNRLSGKPVFANIAGSMKAFGKYFIKSKKFGALFYTNFAVLTFILILLFTRIITGVLRDKPVSQIVVLTVGFVAFIIFYLTRLVNQVSVTTIPDLYKKKILLEKQSKNDLQWNYFLFGTAVLTTTFAPLVIAKDRNFSDSSSSSSCGSGCGSSCSSCGGCGGGD